MAHELDFSKKFAAVAYTNAKPWHGLGQKMVEGQPLEIWLQQSGLNYTVKESPIQYNIGDNVDTPKLATSKNKKVLFRDDNFEELGIVSLGYNVVQPKEIIFFFESLIKDLGFKMNTAGVLLKGKKVWGLAELPLNFTLQDGDQVNGYLLLSTSYDGSFATTCQVTSIRVVCNNTLTLSLDKESHDHVIKVNHLNQFKPETVKVEMGLIEEKWSNFESFCNKLSQTKVNTSERHQIFESIIGYDDKVQYNTIEDINKNKRETVKLLNYLYYNGKGQQMESTKDTAWGVLNAVTLYADYYRGLNPSQVTSSPGRTHKVLFGSGNSLKQKAVQALLPLI